MRILVNMLLLTTGITATRVRRDGLPLIRKGRSAA